MKKRNLVLLFAVIFLSVSIAQPLFSNAMENKADLSITSQLTKGLSSEEDLFKVEEAIGFEEQVLKIHLDYNVGEKGVLKKGSRLVIDLKPEEGETYINYPYKFAKNKTIIADGGEKLADANISSSSVYAGITFEELDKDFNIDFNSSLEANSSKLYKYFEENPEETSLEQEYYLYINGVKTEKKVKFSFAKPKLPEVELKFRKTDGTYKRKGDMGEGDILYNINIGTKLIKSNEFFIYDTPDINLSFEGKSFKAYYSTGTAKLYGDAFFNANNGWQSIGEGEKETRMEAELYDIYFLTKDPASKSKPRQATYEDVTLKLDRYDIINKSQGLDAMDTAAVPENILLEKPHGEELTPAEQNKIDSAGGLNKTVGKGFKFHIKNFNHPLYDKGGSFILIYDMKIKKQSSILDQDKIPLYYNTASYYAQEIPTCDPKKDDKCVPIQCEKTKLEDVQNGKNTVKTPLNESKIGGHVDNYSLIDITKKNEKAEALAGAEFTIYESNEEGVKGEVAVNKDNIALENLISNEEGKLSTKQKDGSLRPVNLKLKRGYYILSESKAPEGYEKAKELFFTVGFKVEPIVVQNTPIKEEPKEPENPEKPKEPENPVEPKKPDTPGEPEKPDNPGKTKEPENPPLPGEEEKPNMPGKVEEPSKSEKPNPKPLETSNSEPIKQKAPYTGDENMFYVWLGLSSIAVCALAIASRKKLQ